MPMSDSTLGAESRWGHFMDDVRSNASVHTPLEVRGTLTRLAGLVLEAVGLKVPVGSQCLIGNGAREPVLAEVVGFSSDRAFLMPAGDTHGLSSGATVTPLAPYRPVPRVGQINKPPSPNDRGALRLPLGRGLLGRVVDSHGNPLDHLGPITHVDIEALDRQPLNSMDRDPVREPLDTGVRAINALLTVGLIGERGREVKEFIEDILGVEGRKRSVVVAAPADAPPLVRMQGATYATAIAERFREDGLHVLLLMDSLTRYAMAQREIALAIGEPPATKGYPPSCFAKLPQLVERSGNGLNGKGSITAFYTVLSEGDDQQDPIADAARAILDGHIVLSRSLAESGHYPAIDVEASASRVMHNVAGAVHLELARKFRSLYSRYMKSRDLIQLGAYAAGSDPETDRAILLYPALQRFLMQDMNEAAGMDDCLVQLARALQEDKAGQAPNRQARPNHNPYRS